ncbi:MAG: replication-associated recombination protein A [Bifidobacteriaceae bacterium]|jgi:putative ATPase|nr:replication-associated recombination protein A [Bifidobacteriaceae bacterium]
MTTDFSFASASATPLSMNDNEPLAYRMRPRKIEDVVGQQHLVGPGKPIAMMVAAHQLSSMILYGPPGTGKTSIASAIAGSTKYPLRLFNAANATMKDLKAIAEESFTTPVVLLLDEIHRLDRVKQDYLLSFIESGQLIVVGATTENPYLNVAPALRSRLIIYEVFPLKPNDVFTALKRAVSDKERGLGGSTVNCGDDVLHWLAERTNGDVRLALNSLEIVVKSGSPVDEEHLGDIISNNNFDMDAAEDMHYDTISAFHESVKGSDVDASLYYLAVLIQAGDMESIIRRLTVLLFEDIELIDIGMWGDVLEALRVAREVGFPKAKYILSSVTIAMALVPKTNSAQLAIDAALEDAKNNKLHPAPKFTQDFHYKGHEALGRGVGFKNPHDFPHHFVQQRYLPESLQDRVYYEPDAAAEERFKAMHDRLRKLLYGKDGDADDKGDVRK